MESWLPVPERLVRDIETAPRADKRAWAIASLVIWVLSFYRLRRGEECSLRDLRAWSCSNSQSRAKAGKSDAQAFLEGWTTSRPPVDQSQTTRRPPVDHRQTRGKQPVGRISDSSGPPVDHRQTTRRPPADRSQTDHARSSLQNTTTSTNTVSVIWADLEAVRTAAGEKRAWSLTAQRRKQIKARLREHNPEDFKIVWEWWRTSDHKRARFLREQSITTNTILGTKFSEYLELATAPAPAPAAPLVTTNSDPFDDWIGGQDGK